MLLYSSDISQTCHKIPVNSCHLNFFDFQFCSFFRKWTFLLLLMRWITAGDSNHFLCKWEILDFVKVNEEECVQCTISENSYIELRFVCLKMKFEQALNKQFNKMSLVKMLIQTLSIPFVIRYFLRMPLLVLHICQIIQIGWYEQSQLT